MYHRHELTLGSDGLLRCPDDRAGKTELELSQEKAAAASDVPAVRGATREY